MPPIRGAGGTESPLYTFPPLHFPPTESPNNTEEQAARKPPVPVGDKKVAPPSPLYKKIACPWATRKSPLPAGPPVPGRQESRPSQQATRKSPVPWATRKSPLPAGDKKIACPTTRKSPLPAGGKKAACPATRKSPLPAGGKKAACPNGRQESRPSQQAARKPPVPVGDKKVAPPAALPRRPQGLPVLVDCQFSSRVNPVKISS